MEMTPEILRGLAQNMVDVKWARSPAHNVALQPPEVNQVTVVQEGNFTIVTLNGTYTGVAKFNPRDVVVHDQYTRNGDWVQVEKSKYSSLAGVQKAMHRAVTKIFN